MIKLCQVIPYEVSVNASISAQHAINDVPFAVEIHKQEKMLTESCLKGLMKNTVQYLS